MKDVYDFDSDTPNPRKNSIWTDGTALDPALHRSVLQAAQASTLLVILLSVPASIESPRLLGYTISLLSLIWAYSSPPFRLKERPILDSISSGVICWLLWASGYNFSENTSLVPETEFFSKHGGFVFLYASAMHSLAAMVDSQIDSAAKHQTIATVCGERFAATFSMVCL